MLDYLGQDPLPNEEFIYQRGGVDVKNMIAVLRSCTVKSAPQAATCATPLRQLHILGQRLHWPHLRSRLLRRLLSEDDHKALAIGRFRLQGEVHHWMYDRYSLATLLVEAGFENPTRKSATESSIEGWVQFNLDTEPDGTVYKPDSLYMEAWKPPA